MLFNDVLCCAGLDCAVLSWAVLCCVGFRWDGLVSSGLVGAGLGRRVSIVQYMRRVDLANIDNIAPT